MRRPLQSPALINAFFDSLRPDQAETAQIIHRAILAAAPQLRAEVKWGNLCYLNDNDNLLSLVLHKVNAHVQVFNGVMLVAEGAGTHVGKGYLYAAMAFSFVVETLNTRMRKKSQLHRRD